ncbi:uncharacterized protein LOC127007649 [Eriocheir sinensis]|uniref:uncharacterized protein LOC127007649 n=1 Tax=Eriocheir sinensis TaxID=95602 RepID=UPI0021C5BB15|nr:uncharacterized protein LOC127007649 [Eriocheir sinensis]XP_050734802.1 uncharacterized protein LOC127007649 [Eriocheir sinensis]
MQGADMASRACMAAVVLACVAAQAGAWSSFSCTLTPVDKERLTNATVKSAQQVNASVSSLEEKVDAILALLTPSGPQQAPWLPPPRTQGTEDGAVTRRGRSEREERSKEDRENTREEDMTEKEEQEEHAREEEEREHVTEKPERKEDTQREENDETERREIETKPESENETEEEEEEEEEESGPKKGECSVMVTDNHATIGMFFMSTYNHGHCANRHPVASPIRYCLGFCPTRTFVTRKNNMWGQGYDCKSCQPSRLESLRIPLVCDDGFQFEKTFRNVVECACRNCRSLKV